MSNQRFDDELLSAIIDDEADTELVASVNESPEASARLEHMRQAVQVVAVAPAEATPERRSASIAAAMAEASPAPEVTSLAAARHVRSETEKKKRSLSGGWIAAVAAAVAFVIAIPIAIGLGGTDATDTATDASAEASDSALSTDDAGEAANAVGDAASDSDVVMETAEAESAMEEEAMEEDAMEEETVASDIARDGADEEAAEEPAESEPTPATTAPSINNFALTADELRNRRGLVAGNNLDVLSNLIDIGTIAPLYSADQVLLADVAAECLQTDLTLISDTPYGLAELTPFARLVLVEFAEDGTSRLLDAEDCAVLR